LSTIHRRQPTKTILSTSPHPTKPIIPLRHVGDRGVVEHGSRLRISPTYFRGRGGFFPDWTFENRVFPAGYYYLKHPGYGGISYNFHGMIYKCQKKTAKFCNSGWTRERIRVYIWLCIYLVSKCLHRPKGTASDTIINKNYHHHHHHHHP